MTAIVLFLVIGISWVIWKLFSVQLTDALRWVRVAELNVIRWIHGDNVRLAIPGLPEQKAEQWRLFLGNAKATEITPLDLVISSRIANIPLRHIFMGLIALMAVIVFLRGPDKHYRRRMGLEKLMTEQAKSFPVIQPFLKFDPRKLPPRAPGAPVPAQLPLFAEALSPEEWLAYHEIKMEGGRIDINAAYQALSQQLGRRWRGPKYLPVHAQGLFAAFALRHVRKRKESEEMLNQMALSWTPDKGFRPTGKLKSWIRKVIKDPKVGGALQKHADQHAFETTALLKCLSRARSEGGVLAPAQFVWLRGHDRTLWYPLNNLGRKSYHAEAAGAMVHYTNELIAAQKIPTPRFEEVISGIETYMKSAARPIPELDRKTVRGKYWKK